jgi:hypothetical protein
MRSSTWSVVGAKRERNVYIGARQAMGHHKLSLHRSGQWRFAQNEPKDDEQDRVLMRYTPPPEVAPGWRLAARVLIPTSSLRTPYVEKSTRDRRPISWWTAPLAGWTMSFNIFLGEQERDDSFTVICAGEVGRIDLPGGCVVWVLADEVNSSHQESQFQELRRIARESDAYGSISFPTVGAWGTENETGRPIIYDLGDLTSIEQL